MKLTALNTEINKSLTALDELAKTDRWLERDLREVRADLQNNPLQGLATLLTIIKNRL